MEKHRKNRRHKVHKICAGYIELGAEHEATLLLDDDKILPIPSQPLKEDIQKKSLADLGTDVPVLFKNFKAKVKDTLQAGHTLQIEKHLQELLSLNNILLLQPLQHGRLMRLVFTDSLWLK